MSQVLFELINFSNNIFLREFSRLQLCFYQLENMKLKRFLLRYHPPGIILEYLRKSGEVETKSIDLLNLTLE